MGAGLAEQRGDAERLVISYVLPVRVAEADLDMAAYLHDLVVGAVGLAEIGRRRAGGRAHWGPTASLWATVWLTERAVTAWLAIGARLKGGVRCRGARLVAAAHSSRSLRSERGWR